MNKTRKNLRFPRKSQGLSINIIIVAVIAIIVLLVTFVIFTDITGKTAKSLGDCKNKGGECADDLSGKECGGNHPIPLIVPNDCEGTDPNNLCCLRIEN